MARKRQPSTTTTTRTTTGRRETLPKHERSQLRALGEERRTGKGAVSIQRKHKKRKD